MKKVTIWDDPRCSNSRQTSALLQGHNTGPGVTGYLSIPPAVEQTGLIPRLRGAESRKLICAVESVRCEQDLDNTSSDRQASVAVQYRYPLLINPAIVFTNDSARIGGLPDVTLEIL